MGTVDHATVGMVYIIYLPGIYFLHRLIYLDFEVKNTKLALLDNSPLYDLTSDQIISSIFWL